MPLELSSFRVGILGQKFSAEVALPTQSSQLTAPLPFPPVRRPSKIGDWARRSGSDELGEAGVPVGGPSPPPPKKKEGSFGAKVLFKKNRDMGGGPVFCLEGTPLRVVGVVGNSHGNHTSTPNNALFHAQNPKYCPKSSGLGGCWKGEKAILWVARIRDAP